MSRTAKLFLILLRIGVGWYFLYQGIIAILNPAWTYAPLIKNSIILPNFYTVMSGPSLVPYASYAIKGLLLLVGGLLIIGIFVRLASLIGIVLTLFFYFPLLHFPYVQGNYIIDEHIITVLVLLFLFAARAGEYFGLGTFFRFSRY